MKTLRRGPTVNEPAAAAEPFGDAADPPLVPAGRTFVVRLSRDSESLDGDWHALVEHPTSGDAVYIDGSAELLDFINESLVRTAKGKGE